MQTLKAWTREVSYSPHGSDEEMQFQFVEDENGNEVLVEAGYTNRYELIQTYKDGVLLENVVKRCVATGDWTPLQGNAFYGDDAALPKNLIELKQFEQKAGALYASLTDEQRAAFDKDGVEGLVTFIQKSAEISDAEKLKSLEAQAQALRDKGVKYE